MRHHNSGYQQNPISPQALRKAFGSIVINKGAFDTIVAFWLGHEIGDMAKAYKQLGFEEVKQD
ncbi:MAG: hypothetical protein ACE5KD_04520 [Candidatus Bathyarchaeia archaeon]